MIYSAPFERYSTTLVGRPELVRLRRRAAAPQRYALAPLLLFYPPKDPRVGGSFTAPASRHRRDKSDLLGKLHTHYQPAHTCPITVGGAFMRPDRAPRDKSSPTPPTHVGRSFRAAAPQRAASYTYTLPTSPYQTAINHDKGQGASALSHIVMAPSHPASDTSRRLVSQESCWIFLRGLVAHLLSERVLATRRRAARP